MSTYYQSLASSSDPARRMGWKRRIGQAYRYELVRQQLRGGESVVDVGCGEAGLATYLSLSGCHVDYMGIEVRNVQVSSGLNVKFADYRDVSSPCCDRVVAIGALVGAKPSTSERLSREKAGELLTWMRRTEASAGLLIAIDLAALDAAPWLSDPELDGLRREWFEGEFTIERVSRFELAVGWGATFDIGRALEDAYAGPFGPFSPAEGAWLAAEVGDVAAARKYLANEDVGDPALAGIVEARIDQLEEQPR